MKKRIAITKQYMPIKEEKVEPVEFIRENIITAIEKIDANYNDRESDQIQVNGAGSVSVIEDEGEVHSNTGYSIDLLDDVQTQKVIKGLSVPGNILECNTFAQTCFIRALLDMPNKDLILTKAILEMDKDFFSSEIIVRPLTVQPHDVPQDHLVFEDFLEPIILESKYSPYTLNKMEGVTLEKGDIVYIENYDMYPEENNGPFSGEYCIVVNSDDVENVLFFGFGLGYSSFKDIKKELDKGFKLEMKECNRKITKKIERQLKKDKIGISVILKLKEELFI